MTWESIFDAAREYDTSVSEIQDRLTARRTDD